MARHLSRPDGARRRYGVAQAVLATAFALTMIGATVLLPRTEEGPLKWLLTLLPVGILALWAWEFFRAVRDDDEMMRANYLRVISISGLLVLLGATAWGILERLQGTPPFPGFLLLPAFAASYGIVSAVLSRRT